MSESNKIYAIRVTDGSVWLTTILPNTSIEEEIKKWPQDMQDKYISHREITSEHVPTNRLFRDAWTDDKPTNTVDVDEDKAKAIHMDRIRHMRNLKLKELDVEMLKSIHDTTKLAEIEMQKQILRDLPNTFSLDKMDLKNPKDTWPEGLDLVSEYKKGEH